MRLGCKWVVFNLKFNFGDQGTQNSLNKNYILKSILKQNNHEQKYICWNMTCKKKAREQFFLTKFVFLNFNCQLLTLRTLC